MKENITLVSMLPKIVLSERDVNLILDFIRRQKGIDFDSYRRTFVVRRLNSRMESVKAETGSAYLKILRDDPVEFSHFFEALSINVTEFFRDPDVFEMFQRDCLRELIRKKKEAGWRLMRIWSAGCASGEEPYSIAIMAREACGNDKDFEVVIHASDIDKAALERAQQAEYKEESLKNVNKKVLEKYFTPVYNEAYQLKDEIKKTVYFQRHNLINDAVLQHMDVVFCRNMMIYLSKEEKEILIDKFSRSLNIGGYLVVGKVESIWNNQSFQMVSAQHKIYRKIDSESKGTLH